jgi:glucan phosphoethanolaminetransferase (alkaline phosphatase superfamily)
MKKLVIPAIVLVYVLALVVGLLIALRPETAIFHPFSLISQSIGILIFSILLFGIFSFIGYVIAAKEYSSLLSLNGWVKITNCFQNRITSSFHYTYTQSQSPWRSWLAGGVKLLVLTAASAYALIFIEWIFHVTKVSFMDSMNLGQKVATFLLSGLVLAAAGMAINIILLLVGFILRGLRLAWLAACINTAVPAALLTSLVVLMVDSFTYTIFRFGILTSDGILRITYGVLVILLFIGLYRWLLRIQGISSPARLKPSTFKWLRLAVLGLLAISSVLAATQFNRSAEAADPGESQNASAQDLPDIILIGGDALSANHMSLYGYARETTPNIDALAEVSLVAENAFTNASKTYGSIISIMTSKLPTRTRVIFPPDILHGTDSDQHLPGILKAMGYSTAQIGVNEYVDANTWNIHDAFDWVNQRTVKGDVLVKTLNQMGYGLPAYFIFTIEGRLANRLLQALCIETIENPFSTIADAPEWRGDRRRIDDLLNLLEGTPEPLFVHVHLLETHGPKYEPAIRLFSAGIEQDEKWMIDFYDDTILSYDAYISELIEALKTSGTFDQTLLILYSDHGMGFQTAERIPLLIHFPADQYAGRIQTNVQNLDIAPTILDFLDVPIPEWMEGDSILQFSTQVREPIFAVRMRADEAQESTNPDSAISNLDPFETEHHQFSVLQIFYCQRMYQLDLIAQEWKIRTVSNHTAPCDRDSLLDLEQARQVAIQFLESQGYDPSVIP